MTTPSDDERFRNDYLRVRQWLERYLARPDADEDLAEDVVDDVLAQERKHKDGKRLTPQYAQKALTNAVIRARTRPDRSSSVDASDPIRDRPAAGPGPGMDAALRELVSQAAEKVTAACATLSAARREVFILRRMHELPDHEIAALLRRSRDSVKKLGQRADQEMRPTLTVLFQDLAELRDMPSFGDEDTTSARVHFLAGGPPAMTAVRVRRLRYEPGGRVHGTVRLETPDAEVADAVAECSALAQLKSPSRDEPLCALQPFAIHWRTPALWEGEFEAQFPANDHVGSWDIPVDWLRLYVFESHLLCGE